MTPKKILLFILTAFFFLLLLSIVFPEKGIKISDNINVNFISVEEILNPKIQEEVDITKILASTNIEEETDSSAFELIIEKSKYDSIMIDSQYVYYEPVPIRIDSVIRHIEFPNNKRTSLNPFFKILANVKNEKKIVRIMHYGDSQIETDRISDYFRYKLQTQFGGYGAGIVPAIKAYDFQTPMTQSYNGAWKRYTVYGRKDTTVTHRKYGMTGNFARFTPIINNDTTTLQKDSSNFIQNEVLMPHKIKNYASLTFSQSKYSFKPTKQYKRCKLYYGNAKTEVKVKVFADEVKIAEDILKPTNDYSYKTWTFEKAPKDLKFEFEAEESPDFYSFSLEGYSGINVDNIAMRGSSGLFFTSMNLNLLSRMYSQLNTRLIILQFGGNIVPGERKKYGWYRKSFSRQIRTLKKIAPNATIMVIGLADMSKKEDEIYVSYSNITLIRDALKKASFENDCAYWDMYEAMGGENSMPSWVFHEPPLGEKDFTHFTPQGARYIAKMFYNAFMYEYNRYLKTRK